MKLMKVMLLAAVVLTSASAAQASGTMTFGVGGGVTMPMGDFAKVAKLGFNGGVYGDYWLKDNYAFGVDITGNFLSAKDDYTNLLKSNAYPNPSFKETLISFGLHGKWVVPMKDAVVSPWLTYGVAMYNAKAKIEDAGPVLNGDTSDNKFGFNGGGGLDFKGSASMKPGVDVKYHYVMTDDKATTYLTAGVHVTFTTSGMK